MNHNPDVHRRRSNRLAGYDYSLAGRYFVTIVTEGRSCCFGEVAGDEMRLNDAGQMACRTWEELPERFAGIKMDYFVVMPNHLHGIVVLSRSPTGAEDRATTRVAPTLGSVIGAYKSLTTVEYTRGVGALSWPPFERRLWQRNYYEHIVRDNESLSHIRQYILDNPAQWDLDQENPMTARPQDAGP